MKSDLSGKEDDPEKFGSFIIRKGPGIESAIAWDVLPDEVGDLTEATNVYVVEYRDINGDTTSKIVTGEELATKVVPKGKKLEELVEAARFLRGRRPGTR